MTISEPHTIVEDDDSHQISATIIADTISRSGKRITSIQITAHRFILAEINTHRVLSRNYRSSRAVPTSKLIEEVNSRPARPVHWGKNKPGMQATEEVDSLNAYRSRQMWDGAAAQAARSAAAMLAEGVHKQVVNRILEPFLYVHGIITATEWSNFFELRLHPDAQPEFRVLAEAMKRAMEESQPREAYNSWHLPYIGSYEEEPWTKNADINLLLNVSAARCARVSYKAFDGTYSPLQKDIELANNLLSSGHMSPFEHQAKPDEFTMHGWRSPDLHGNFEGWIQYRKTIHGECR